jgi:hypothetical protein
MGFVMTAFAVKLLVEDVAVAAAKLCGAACGLVICGAVFRLAICGAAKLELALNDVEAGATSPAPAAGKV